MSSLTNMTKPVAGICTDTNFHGQIDPLIDPANLVCKRCWTACFSIEDFRELCQNIGSENVVGYTVDKDDSRASASKGCKWCALILQLDEQSEELVPRESRNTSSKHQVQLSTGIFHETFTPVGNNRFRIWVNGISNHLTAFTSVGNAASDIVTARPLRSDVGSDQAFQEISKWLKRCATHPKCGPPSEPRLPTRVIEVSSEDSPRSPRLLSTKGLHGKYAALSYCWGANQLGVTTKANLDCRLLALDVKALSKTVQEAIVTTQRIGVRYLWVDAICIIQDSEEDKATEIQQMCDIYQRAYVTIVAANAADSNQGFLQGRPPPAPSVEIPFWSADGRLGSVWMRSEGWYDDDSEPVNTRGWTLQERLLSPRLVIFASHTIQFQCQQATVNLGDSLHIPSGLGSWRLPSVLIGLPQNTETKELTSEAAIEAWKDIIMLYSQRDLSYDDDKLVALAALAQAFHAHIQVPYLAGLWSGPTLPSLLLWEPVGYGKSSTYQAYVAPSWSWASLPTPVTFRGGHRLQELASFSVDVLSSIATFKNPTLPFGKVSGGSLMLRAHLKPARFVPPHGLKWKESAGGPSQRPPAPPSGVYSSDFAMPDSNINAKLDSLNPFETVDVVCLAVVSRSYEYGGIQYRAVDGLLIEQITRPEGPHVYRRVGCFFGAMEEEFANSERREVTLV
jgi:hypothetical protein